MGPDEDMLTPDSPVEETPGFSKPVKSDLTPAIDLSLFMKSRTNGVWCKVREARALQEIR